MRLNPRPLSLACRRSTALALCYLWPLSTFAQQTPAAKYEKPGAPSTEVTSIEPIRPSAPVLWRPYLAATVPAVHLANSSRVRDLVRAGKLYLSAQDTVALALENNVDIEVARYNPISLAWQVERAEAGGALPGVPSGATQASSVASGQGVLGSQAAAGQSISGSNGTNRATANATVTQLGPVTQTLDPTIQEGTTFSHKSLPQPNSQQSITDLLIQNQRIYTGSYQQGLVFGGSVTVSYNNHYLNENAPSDVLNPSVAPTLSISVQQSLLQGFGAAVGGRTIKVAKINFRNSDLNFKTQVISVVVNALNAYYSLVGDYEDLKAKQSALDTAQSFLGDTRKQLDLGALAPLDVTTAESQAATSSQNLVDSRTALSKDELTLKNLISRTGTADPLIASAQIIPVDHIVIPPTEDLPPAKDLVVRALANRTDLAAERLSLQTTAINNIGTRNAVLPSLQVFAGTSDAGLAGSPKTVVTQEGVESANPYFVGGIGTALGQVFRRNFPTENGGAFFSIPLRNRQALSDANVDELSLRQSQLTTEKDLKQAQVDVLNAMIALRQARARYDAAVAARVLDEQLLDAENRKFKLGASTPYNVIQQQRDLAAARSTEIGALVTYGSARISLDQLTGSTLEANHVSISEALNGRIARDSSVPANPIP